MKYEIRNQADNVPYVEGLRDEIVHAHNNGKTLVEWNNETIAILGHKVTNGTMVINIHIPSI